MTTRFDFTRRRVGVILLLLAAAPVPTACSQDQLLTVTTPDQITTSAVQSASGAQTVRAAAIGRFAQWYGGDQNDGPTGLNVSVAILGDEAYTARSGTEHLDSRAQINANFPVTSPWSEFGTAFATIVRAIRLLNQYPPAGSLKATQLGQLYVLKGFTYTLMGENYCSGIPFSNVNDNSPSSTNLLTADMFTAAQASFDTALATLSTSGADLQFRYGARVGKGRTFLDQNDYASAAAQVQAAGDTVPVSYVYNVEYSAFTSDIINGAEDWMLATPNFGASDKEGINGLDYVSSHDPRIHVDGTKMRAGQDGTPIPTFLQFPLTSSPVPLASGVEAQMILAENYLKSGDITHYLAAMNTARATVSALAPLTDPGDPTSRVNVLFRERAFWMYFTAHRIGDMRRLVNQYGRGVESVYPTGPYLHGGRYGTDVVLYPAQSETNNPNWQAPPGRTEDCTYKGT